MDYNLGMYLFCIFPVQKVQMSSVDSWIVMKAVNGLGIAFKISDDLFSLDGDHQTAECHLLNGERWRVTRHWMEEGRVKRRWRLVHTPPLTHVQFSTEGGEAVMVGFHPSPSCYWQEQEASHTHIHTHTHTHIHTHHTHTQSCPLITPRLCKSAHIQIGLLSLVPGFTYSANWSLQESHCNWLKWLRHEMCLCACVCVMCLYVQYVDRVGGRHGMLTSCCPVGFPYSEHMEVFAPRTSCPPRLCIHMMQSCCTKYCLWTKTKRKALNCSQFGWETSRKAMIIV